MLSVCIPIYNFDVRAFVQDLHKQLSACNIAYEILCYDDCSATQWKQLNRPIRQLKNVQYIELEKNQGRAKIRNTMAKAAKYSYLLFLDCDGKVTHPNFIQNYISAIAKNTVVCGGRSYSTTPPKDNTFFLHWKYGQHREVKAADSRNKNPYHGFQTNNFLIPKNTLLNIQFDENLTQYGHEDTLFGMELQRHATPILHIDNAVQHIGLEGAHIWLRKQELALKNLHLLKQNGHKIQTRLTRLEVTLRKYNLHKIASLILRPVIPYMRKNLLGKHPRLWCFDLYKLEKWFERIEQKADN